MVKVMRIVKVDVWISYTCGAKHSKNDNLKSNGRFFRARQDSDRQLAIRTNLT